MTGHVARVEEMRNVSRVLADTLKKTKEAPIINEPLGISRAAAGL
jgi:hypothetical protein